MNYRNLLNNTTKISQPVTMFLPNRPPHFDKHQKGFSLLEVMIAMMVLAMGLLGAVALQFASAKEQRASQYTSRAALIANEIAERMRTNRLGVEQGFYLNGTSDTYATMSQQALSIPAPCNPQPSCTTPATSAAIDLAYWQQSARSSLPQPAVLLLDPANANRRTTRDIVVAWAAPIADKDSAGVAVLSNNTNNGCPTSIRAPAGIKCFQMRFVL